MAQPTEAKKKTATTASGNPYAAPVSHAENLPAPEYIPIPEEAAAAPADTSMYSAPVEAQYQPGGENYVAPYQAPTTPATAPPPIMGMGYTPPGTEQPPPRPFFDSPMSGPSMIPNIIGSFTGTYDPPPSIGLGRRVAPGTGQPPLSPHGMPRHPEIKRIESFPNYFATHETPTDWTKEEMSDYIRRRAMPGRSPYVRLPDAETARRLYPDTYKGLPPDSAVDVDPDPFRGMPMPSPPVENRAVPLPAPRKAMSPAEADLMYASLSRTVSPSEARNMVCAAGGSHYCSW